MTGPLILIVLGILLLLNNLNPEMYPFRRVWPVILVVIGIAKVLESVLQRRGKKPPSGPSGASGPSGPSGPSGKESL
jgi:hypothetical protein